jgi:TrkA-N domain
VDRVEGDRGVTLPSIALALAFGAIAVLSFALGYVGLAEYVHGLSDFRDRPVDILYYDLQLFIINSPPVSNGGPYPMPLEIARFSAPAATAYALMATVRVLLDAQFRQFRARMSRHHAVVCGGGPAALLLGQRLHHEGRAVVLVGEEAQAREARSLGILHVTGDPRDEHVLRRAGTARAAEVFVLHADSAASAATVLTVARLSTERPPTCYAAIADRDVYAGLLARHLAWPSRHRLPLHLLNLDEMAAQALLEAEPPPDGQGGHVVVIGLGNLGQALMVELARSRRSSYPFPNARPLVVTAADEDAPAITRRLAHQAPVLAQVCEIRSRRVPSDLLDEASLPPLLAEGPPPDCVYVCCDDDSVALRVGLRTLRARHHNSVRVVVCLDRGSAFSAAFHGDDRLFDDAWGTLRVLAVPELLLRPDLIRGSLVTEQLARALHASYIEACVGRGERPGERPALQPWERLPEPFRDSNRDQARHLGEKLEAIGCILVPSFDTSLGFTYRDDEEVERLARMEHERWVRERHGRGFVHGARRDGRHHPDVVDWEQLTSEARDKAVQSVRALPGLLHDLGFHVLRVAPHA